MIPTSTDLLNSLLLFLLPGFITLKVWNIFFPRTPSEEQDGIDKVATYFSFTLFTYLVSFPFIAYFVGNASNNFYLAAIIASIVGGVLGTLFSLGYQYYLSSNVTAPIRQFLKMRIPHSGSLWHKFFLLDRREEEIKQNKKLFVKVTVSHKNTKSFFLGELHEYPIEDNITDTKDFALRGVTEIKDNGIVIPYPPETTMLFNQRDVDYILYQYASNDELRRIVKRRKRKE